MDAIAPKLNLDLSKKRPVMRVVPPPPPMDLGDAFDRVVAINLPRRTDRLGRLHDRLAKNWPFKFPETFSAFDGSELKQPPTWPLGPGAWGCLQSHRAVLDRAIAHKVSTLLVLEDDAYPVDNFSNLAEAFLSRVPDDWNCIMFGAEHLIAPIPVAAGVVRCVGSIRCHAYALRGPLMEMLSVFWQCNKTDHCDLVLSSLMRHYPVYAPSPLLVGQDEGQSDITPKVFPRRFLPEATKPTLLPAVY